MQPSRANNYSYARPLTYQISVETYRYHPLTCRIGMGSSALPQQYWKYSHCLIRPLRNLPIRKGNIRNKMLRAPAPLRNVLMFLELCCLTLTQSKEENAGEIHETCSYYSLLKGLGTQPRLQKWDTVLSPFFLFPLFFVFRVLFSFAGFLLRLPAEAVHTDTGGLKGWCRSGLYLHKQNWVRTVPTDCCRQGIN